MVGAAVKDSGIIMSDINQLIAALVALPKKECAGVLFKLYTDTNPDDQFVYGKLRVLLAGDDDIIRLYGGDDELVYLSGKWCLVQSKGWASVEWELLQVMWRRLKIANLDMSE